MSIHSIWQLAAAIGSGEQKNVTCFGMIGLIIVIQHCAAEEA